MKVEIEGKEPLIGNIEVSGSKNSAIKLISASLFSNDDIVIENIPKVTLVESDLEILKSMGAKTEWLPQKRLLINCSSVKTYEIPYEIGSKFRTTALITGPLLYRFGRAKVPKPKGELPITRPINRWVYAWEVLGYDVKEDEHFYMIEAGKPQNAEISFKVNTVMGTENAILSSVSRPSTTTINNAAAEPEVDDLIEFLNSIGASIKRVEERKIIINGTESFSGGKFKVMPDRSEAVVWAVAALCTYGDISINGVNSSMLLPFIRKLEAMGASFEFKGNTLRVWRARNKKLTAVNIETAPAPGFMTEWQPYFSLLLTQAEGESFVHETIYTDRFSFTKDLNRMGAKTSLFKPSEVGLDVIVSDDFYDVQKYGEPFTVLKVAGPTELKREKLSAWDIRNGVVLPLAALSAEGRSEVLDFESTNFIIEGFSDKLKSLGAKIN